MRTLTLKSPPRLWILSLAMVAALSAASVAHASWPHSPGINVPICTATNEQFYPKAVSDGAGGAIITWYDLRGGTAYDVYAQHVLASGAVDPTWPANGRALSTAADEQSQPTIVSDGAGGAIVAWKDLRNAADFDVYAQHVLASGAVDPTWPANGRQICGAAGDQVSVSVASDGAGGAIVTWSDYRSGVQDIYAQHVPSSGVVDGAWPVNGAAICVAPFAQANPMLIPDGAGGAIITWYDYRTNSSFDIYAQRVLASGVVDGAWPANGLAVCTAGNSQYQPTLVADGSGGAIIAWYDERPAVGVADIYAQRVLASGVVDPAWPLNGRALCTAGGQQYYQAIIGDGAGGAIVTWQDARNGPANVDVYAQHVLSSGVADGAWPTDGRALCSFAEYQVNTTIVSDGFGGAIVAWEDFRSGSALDVYAQHVFASGLLDPAWPTHGSAVSTAPSHQYSLTSVSDGAGGVIVAWHDQRGNGVNYDLYAQRITQNGYLGNPEPVLASVRDVPNDNGGKVKLTWSASYLDTEQPYLVDHYWIFRNAPPNVAETALAKGVRRPDLDATEPLPGELAYFVVNQSTTTYYWEFIASSPAAHFASTYSYVASTNSDSVGAGNPKTAFLVVAYNAGGTLFFQSNPDSGYSVDNVPPITPEPLTGNYLGGATHLHWNPNPESDLGSYRIHRGSSADFDPVPGNLIASPPDTGYADIGAVGDYYKLSAVDVHGNESGYALLAPSNTVDVRGNVPRELSFGRPTPNPATARVTVHLALPREGRVSLAIHDIAGRQIRSLISGVVAVGERDVTWDLRDASGAPAADGIYFMRLEAQGRRLARAIAVVH